jgi:outer membrane protein assembly factor BamB
MRDNENPNETALTPATAGKLHLLWATKIGDKNTQYANTEPIIAANVPVNGKMTDIAYVGDEHGFFTAINAVTGAVIWSKTLGVEAFGSNGCYDIPDKVFGVTETPTIDRNTNRVYVVDGLGMLYAFDLATGNIASGWPAGGVKVVVDPFSDHVYSALSLNASHTALYVSSGAYCDFNHWEGALRTVNTQSASVTNVWYTATAGTSQPTGSEYGGGIWSFDGVATDPVTGNLYEGTGNTFPDETTNANSDAMLEWSPQLSKLAASRPLNAKDDDDFGGSTLLYNENGSQCLIALRKDGQLFSFDRTNIGSGPKTQLNVADYNFEDIESLAHSSAAHLLYLANPSAGVLGAGVIAFRPGANCTFSNNPVWQQPFMEGSSASTSAGVVTAPPTVAGGLVFQAAGSVVEAFNATTGQSLWNSGSSISSLLTNSATVVNGRVYITDWSDHLYAFGL